MAKLKDKIQNMLDEARMLVLGSQVLVGFQFRSAFESGFTRLPRHAQYMKVGALALMLCALALLCAPAAFHRLVEGGEDTRRLHRFSSRMMELALLPFAVGLGTDIFVATEKVFGHTPGAAAGLAGLGFALFFWWGLEWLRRARREPEIGREEAMSKKEDESEGQGTKLKDKIKHVLTEARTVLPGAQALLGFQFICVMTDAFDKLPDAIKYVHLASLALVAVSIVLLMTPAAYHRLVERGEETEHFHRFSSRILIAAMIPLALGVTGSFFVVLDKVSQSTSVSVVAAGLLLALFYGLWFGYTAYARAAVDERRSRAA
jgi:DMSO reductase anchor subunit